MLEYFLASCQSDVSVSLLSLSAQMFAALRMYCVLILMSFSSVRRKSFLSSDIMAGDLDVRWVRTTTTDWLSSCNNNLLLFSSVRNDLMAQRTALLQEESEGAIVAFNSELSGVSAAAEDVRICDW